MAKARHEIEREFIATAKEKTGHDLQGWMDMIKASELDKNNAIVKWIKQEHGLNHMLATMLAGIYLNDGKPVFDAETLFARLFDGKEAQRPLYDKLAQQIQATLNPVQFVPTKTYVSLEDQRVFGCVKINKTNLRVGLDLGDLPFDDYIQQARGLGAMPNISHMIEIASEAGVTQALVDYVKQAYDRAHKK